MNKVVVPKIWNVGP